MATEQTLTLTGFTCTQVETTFQLENRLQTFTQIFGTLQAPAVAGVDTADHTSVCAFNVGAGSIGTFELLVTKTAVNAAVQRNGSFSLYRTCSEAGDQRGCKQTFFHE